VSISEAVGSAGGPQRVTEPARTAWARNLETPLRSFLRTESGSAAVLLAATIAALVWANVAPGSYRDVWETTLSVRIGGYGISEDLRYWLNSGLMAFFFFIVGLEARREFDMGELRERRRVTLPLVAGIGGMLVPVAIFLAFNAGGPAAHGWGVAMSTDTAFALGLLVLLGPRFPDRLRAFMLSTAVVDDLIALLVIAVVYTEWLEIWPLVAAVGLFAAILVTVRLNVPRGPIGTTLAVAMWVALHASGVDPIVAGLACGLVVSARPVARSDLERATDLFRLFREQPTADLARTARIGLRAAVSPNERLQRLHHPWTSYVVVPAFALANAGIAIDAELLRRAFTSPLTLGILVGYVVGKPVGIAGASALATRLSRGRLRPPVGWGAVTGGGAIAGIGFTVALLIAELAFDGPRLEEAKVGILAAALCAALLTWTVFRTTARLPRSRRIRALLGTSETLVDLAVPVDPERDHIRGPADSAVTIVEYGDFECPYCGQAEEVLRGILRDLGDVRYVWRHLPLNDVHPWAQLAAEAAEAAARQGAFWEMHDALLARQGALSPEEIERIAGEIGLDLERFREALERHTGAGRIAEDVDSADLSEVVGTPTFFINERRHHGAYDLPTLLVAARRAGARASLVAP
jgi:Na+/H+ antiporter NhaA